MRGWINGDRYLKNEDEGEKLKMGGGSWTINLEEIDLTSVKFVEYRTPRAVYTIDSQVAQERGFTRSFRGELKLVVPIKYWNIKEVGNGKDKVHGSVEDTKNNEVSSGETGVSSNVRTEEASNRTLWSEQKDVV